MATQYPSSIDTTVTLPLVFDLISPVLADDHNRLRNAIIAIQSELGINPSGVFGTAKDRLDDIDSQVSSLAIYVMALSASQIDIVDTDGYFSATTVEGALRELYLAVDELSGLPANLIGAAEDGDYTDGLFTDLTTTTPVGTAVDRFNEVLKELAPSPAPALSDISWTSVAGAEGKLSFGATNTISGYTNVGNISGEGSLDVNGTFPNNSTHRRGVYAATFGTKTGVLADAVTTGPGSPTASYPADAFGNADQGDLEIHVNGVLVHSVDLSVFGSGTSATSGTGFTLSSATSINFPSGTPFALFKYRTGTWTVSTTHEQNGYNYVQVKHVIGPTTYSSNVFEWVIDDNATATSYSAESLTSLSMSGSKYLSGVQYHTSGSATYAITISNAYRNTFSPSSVAIYHTASTNCLPAVESITNLAGAPYEASTIALSKSAPITATTLYNGQITARTSLLRTVQGTITSTGASQSFILMDATADSATATNEPLTGETYRVPSNRSLTDTSGFTVGGAGLWTSATSIIGATPGYTDGLLVYSGGLFYPSSASVVNSGNFSTIANGPGGNPNYSTALGTRTYWRYFYFASSTQNFVLNIAHTGANFKTVASGISIGTGDANIELLAPNTTSNGVSVEFKDVIVSYTTDNAIGCHAATYGSTAYTSWGMTLGTQSTATSGSAIILRITVPSDWTATISNISVTAA